MNGSINKRQPRNVGGVNFAFVARGYPTTINSKAKEHSARGYSYRIVPEGRQCALYIGPKRIRERVKKEKVKKTKKEKKVK